MISEDTKTKLEVLGIEEFAKAIENQQRAGTFDTIPFEKRFDNLVDYVYEAKYQKKVISLRRRAKLRFPDADIRDIYYEDRPITKEMIANLSTCNYLLSHHDIGIEGACGSGKTWLHVHSLTLPLSRRSEFFIFAFLNFLKNSMWESRPEKK